MNEQLRNLIECPCCHSSINQAKQLFATSILGEMCLVVECTKYSLIYKNKVPTSLGLNNIYQDSYIHFQKNSEINSADINTAKQKLSRCQKLLPFHHKPSDITILDIGCGSGTFVEIARNLGYLAEGIDPYLPEGLKKPYLHQKSPEMMKEKYYDVVVLLNVAEHLDKPYEMFSKIKKLLKPEGVLLLTCPYGNSLARRFYQKEWGHLALDEHLLFWTPSALTYLLREIGFQGKFNYRISGSPFPYGKVAISSSDNNKLTINQVEETNIDSESNKMSSSLIFSIQSKMWQLARQIQQRELVANLVRYIIHVTHTGDYLEYAICLGEESNC